MLIFNSVFSKLCFLQAEAGDILCVVIFTYMTKKFDFGSSVYVFNGFEDR